MKLTFINVGYGEAVLACYHNYVILIDGGSAEEEEYAGGKARVRCLDYLKSQDIDHIDLLINTHIHEDHTCGLALTAAALPVKEYCSAVLPESNTPDIDDAIAPNPSAAKFIHALNDHKNMLNTFRASNVPCRKLHAGMILEPVNGIKISVLAPQSEMADSLEKEIEQIYTSDDPLSLIQNLDSRMNNYSIMLRIECEGCSALLVGDTNKAGYGRLMDTPKALRSDVFKIGHHGQIDGAAQEQLNAIRPKYVVFCSSSDRRYNSAHPQIIDMVRNSGAEALFTDPEVYNGHQAVEFTFNSADISRKFIFTK